MSILQFIVGALAASFFALVALGMFFWELFTIGREIDHDRDSDD